MSKYGEKVGSLIHDGSQAGEGQIPERLFHFARHLQTSVIKGVFAGAGLIPIWRESREDESIDELYGQPPISSKAKAMRLGATIAEQLDIAQKNFPYDRLHTEMNTFIPTEKQ
jgi:hypothetical protein